MPAGTVCWAAGEQEVGSWVQCRGTSRVGSPLPTRLRATGKTIGANGAYERINARYFPFSIY